MDPIKGAFQRVKEEINLMKEEMNSINKALSSFKSLIEITNFKIDLLIKKVDGLSFYQKDYSHIQNPAHLQNNPAHLQQTPLNQQTIQHKNLPFNQQKASFLDISTGNGGVPANRQTNQQTDKDRLFSSFSSLSSQNSLSSNPLKDKAERAEGNKNRLYISKENASLNQIFKNQSISNPAIDNSVNPFNSSSDSIKDALEALNSIDLIKKEIKHKFESFTDQEFLVFSTIYQLDEQEASVNYKTISLKLNLTESSIRDYISRLLNKGAPIVKERINNKMIKLSISSDFKKAVSLNSILSLRSL